MSVFSKRTAIRFIGGHRDGQVMDSSEEIPGKGDLLHTNMILFNTNGGQIGKQFLSWSDHVVDRYIEAGTPSGEWKLPNHLYSITAREETDDTIRLTATFDGPLHRPKN